MSLNETAAKIVIDYVKTQYQFINVKAGVGRFNYQCHMNAVNDAIISGWDKIAMCVYIVDGAPIVHFLNVDDDGNYIDNTLGHWSQYCEYYLVRHVMREEFRDIGLIHTNMSNYLKSLLPWFILRFGSFEC